MVLLNSVDQLEREVALNYMVRRILGNKDENRLGIELKLYLVFWDLKDPRTVGGIGSPRQQKQNDCDSTQRREAAGIGSWARYSSNLSEPER